MTEHGDEYVPDGEAVGEGVEEAPSPSVVDAAEAVVLKALVAERTDDLQRLQAEYANYKKRVDRDRALARQSGIEAVVTDLMPVLDAVSLARSHADLDGGFKLVAEELERMGAKYGLTRFGEVGEVFDPTLHDALMQVQLPTPVDVATVSQVVQAGYKLAERVIRPARVAVAQPGSPE